jgi:hypothetical protein
MALAQTPKLENLSRSTAVESVLASFGMEGLRPDARTAQLLDEYRAGTITLEELGAAIERHVTRMASSVDPA